MNLAELSPDSLELLCVWIADPKITLDLDPCLKKGTVCSD